LNGLVELDDDVGILHVFGLCILDIIPEKEPFFKGFTAIFLISGSPLYKVPPVKKAFVVLGISFLALAGMAFGFMAKRTLQASSFGTSVEFNPLVLDAPASSQSAGALGQACNN
jgi:hypothetical protein